MATLTRIRIEGQAADEMQLRSFLLDVWERARNNDLGDWKVEDEEYVVTTTGFWGRLTLRRKGERGA